MIITFIGAMAGSTGGGFKVSRVILLFKETRKEFSLLVHPRNVKTVKMDGKTIDHSVMRSTSIFLVLYIGIFALSWLVLSDEFHGCCRKYQQHRSGSWNGWPCRQLFGIQYFVKNYFDFRYVSRQTRIVPVDVAVRPVSVEKIVSKLKRL